jgi:hypothetical protein
VFREDSKTLETNISTVEGVEGCIMDASSFDIIRTMNNMIKNPEPSEPTLELNGSDVG